jgi:hypothetical protein
LAELQPGELNAYQNGGVQGLADFRRSMRNLTSLTTSGRTGDDTGGGDLTTTGTDITNTFSRSLGALDELDTTRSADEYADFLATLGITNTTQLTDSGLSNQDILDMINAGIDTVNVTDTTGSGTTGGNITDTTGLDTGPVIPTGSDNLETVTIVDKKCDPGYVYDEDLKQCVPIKTVDDSCPTGFYKDSTGKCVPIEEVKVDDKKCDPGYVYDEDLKQCVPIETVTVTDKKCDPGYVYDEDLKQCVPVKTVDDSCPTGFHKDSTGKCVPIEEVKVDDKKCPPGQVYDEDLKQCVPVKTVDDSCPTGFHKDESGKCVPDTKETLSCPEGYEPNEAGTACIPVVTIVDKKCPPGQVYDEELKKCVPIADDSCPTGFHKDSTGKCVPDDDEKCKDGYEKVDGKCVPVCKEGYIRNLKTGACEKAEKECPPGQTKNAEGKCVPIKKTEECQPGYERIDGVCVPKCKTGYQRINGVCVLKCQPGYTLVNGVCVPTPMAPTTSVFAEGERTDPIYAEGMDDFDLFATLEELLADDSGKTDKKKDSKKSKDKTKMATGGHLDDLLAEQMTVDDLLKLLR